ncbi:MAG: integrase core domain-containing protein [Alphaproteobacteria bacterium]
MITFLELLLRQIVSCIKSRAEVQLENALLRHQIDVLRRNAPKRLRVTRTDRSIFKLFLKLWPSSARFIQIVHPKTVIRWHQEGFRLYWRWKSRRFGRPRTANEIRMLIWKLANENPLWGAPRIHGELLKLGFDVSQATVSRYLPRQRPNPDQTWRTFIRNHLDCSAAIDFFVVPTLTFRVLYVVVILNLERRKLVHLAVTANPTAAWTAQQITEAFPWDEAPCYLLRDQDCTYGAIYKYRLEAMGISDTPVAPRSPWQNAYVERVIGSIRRECLDHVIVRNERHLRRILKLYMGYYNRSRTHLSLNKDPPIHRPISPRSNGKIVCFPEVGGLHHRYERVAA